MSQRELADSLRQENSPAVGMARLLIEALTDIEFLALCHRAHILKLQEEE